jgi:hypothetical protein
MVYCENYQREPIKTNFHRRHTERIRISLAICEWFGCMVMVKVGRKVNPEKNK